jgi:hypothetical protein
MKKEIKEILPGIGLGQLKFGMTKNDVIAMIGKPDEIENVPGFEEEEVNDELESWHYDESEFSLVFDAAYDWRLVSIAVSDPFFTLWDKSIVGADKLDVLAMIESKGYSVTHEEDLSDEETLDLKLFEYEDLGMMIWFAGDETIEIQILPDVEDDGESIKWPA